MWINRRFPTGLSAALKKRAAFSRLINSPPELSGKNDDRACLTQNRFSNDCTLDPTVQLLTDD